MKKRLVIPILGAGAILGYFWMKRQKRDNDTMESLTLVDIAMPDQSELMDDSQLENAEMVYEDFHDGNNYYNEMLNNSDIYNCQIKKVLWFFIPLFYMLLS